MPTRDANPLPESGHLTAQIFGAGKDWSLNTIKTLTRRVLLFLVWSFLVLGLAVLVNLIDKMLVPYTAFLYLPIAALILINPDSAEIALFMVAVDALFDLFTKDRGFTPKAVHHEDHIDVTYDLNFERARQMQTLKEAARWTFWAVLAELCIIAFLSFAELWGQSSWAGIWLLLTIILVLSSTKWGQGSPTAWFAGLLAIPWLIITGSFVFNPISRIANIAYTRAIALGPGLMTILAILFWMVMLLSGPQEQKKSDDKGGKK
ncbi:MAG TPA: hypothetical protein VFX17_02975 [Patescibacteria group bacterium]|nr:hypothetical protein [Patescibacteria group bacterium]